MTIVLAVVLCLLLLLGGLWFVSDSRAAGRAHDDALALWESKEPTAYSFDYSYCDGMCMGCPVRVTVKNGEVTDVVGIDPAGCTLSGFQGAPTIEDIFAMEKRGRSAEMTDSFDIDYDPTWGFPASVELRCPEDTSDCGTGFGVSNFRAEPESPRSSAVERAASGSRQSRALSAAGTVRLHRDQLRSARGTYLSDQPLALVP